jgi:hypothetical protein
LVDYVRKGEAQLGIRNLKCVLCPMCSDCETYISADDLRINLWNLEVSDQSFNIVDIKPVNMEDLTGLDLSRRP